MIQNINNFCLIDTILNSSPPGAKYMYSNHVNICLDNVLSLIRYQAIIYSNAMLLSVEHLGANLMKIQNFRSLKCI